MRGQPTPVTQVQRRQISLHWQERGWIIEGNAYAGNFQTPYAAFQGWIEPESSGRPNFYLHNPSDEIRRHSHWTCFQRRGNDWYLVHMSREPKDVELRNHHHRKTDHRGLPAAMKNHTCLRKNEKH